MKRVLNLVAAATVLLTFPHVLVAGPPPSCAADLNGDGVVGSADLALLLGSWGPCPESCSDEIQNQDETDIDCGGATCPPCPAGSGCIAGSDCESGVCMSAVCQACDPEVCDNLDNDCDGQVDEDNPGGGALCDGADSDACEEGIIVCMFGALNCDDTSGDSIELCDGMDNDCDGTVDEGFPNLGAACSVGTGECQAAGTMVCTGDGTGTECSAEPGNPTSEVCDGLDNDCNGMVDDGACAPTEACCAGMCADIFTDPSNCGGCGLACAGGESCEAGTCQACDPEVCDNLDNDCDGQIDEDNPGGGALCDGADSDACEEGIILCLNGSLTCDDATGDSVEVCDGLDNDCDGVVDDNACAVGESCCGAVCVDLSSDPSNCGVCGTVCEIGENCVAGQCMLP